VTIQADIHRWNDGICSPRADNTWNLTYFTDASNALLFADHWGHMVRYVHDLKLWIIWDGTRWKPDVTGEVTTLAIQTCLSLRPWILGTLFAWTPPQQRQALQFATNSLNTSKLTGMLRLAQDLDSIGITSDQLDTHIWLLPCANGTLDLQTFELRPADPNDYMTKSTGLSFDASARLSANSKAFLKKITMDDQDLLLYLQQVFGYTLTGDTGRRLVWFFHGPGGRNGKSTLLKQVRYVMGDFAQLLPVSVLEKQRFSRGIGGASPEIVKLKGARFVTASESEQNMDLSASKLKELVGNEAIIARGLYQAAIEFEPQFKLFLATNFRPNIPARDNAVWHRLRLVPFEYVIPDADIDERLGDDLKTDAVAWLAWMAAGLYMLYRDGLVEASAVTKASQSYREDMDTFSDFIDWLREEDANREEGHAVNSCVTLIDYGLGSLHKTYLSWADINAADKLSARQFSERMVDRGFEKTKKHPREYVWPTDRSAKPGYTIGEYQEMAKRWVEPPDLDE
jgi:putative DNA primase/helicase